MSVPPIPVELIFAVSQGIQTLSRLLMDGVNGSMTEDEFRTAMQDNGISIDAANQTWRSAAKTPQAKARAKRDEAEEADDAEAADA